MIYIPTRNISDVPGFPGQLCDESAIEGGGIISRVNGTEAKQTVGTLTAVHGGTNAGDFSITVSGESASSGTFTSTVTFAATSSNTATEVAAGLVALLNADENINDVLVASNEAGVITLTVRYSNVNPIETVAGAATGTGNTLTASPTVTDYTAAGAISFGYAVGAYSTTPDNGVARITTATGLTQLGIAKRIITREANYPRMLSDTDEYAAGATVEIVRRGRIWAPVAAAVTRYTQPFFLNATGQLTANGAASATALSGAVFLTSASAGEVAQVEINLP